MTNPPQTQADVERERRQETTASPYTTTNPHVTIDGDLATPRTADGRPLGDTTAATPYHTPTRGRNSWGTLLAGIAVILLIVFLLVWLL